MSYDADPTRYDGKMTYRRTGRSGLDLPVLSLGYWHNFGDEQPFERQRQIATALVAAIRERVLTDLHTAAELSRERD